MSVTAGIISGFDQARRMFRDAELARAAKDQDREFSILQALALHPDDSLAKIGAAGLLNIAQGGSPRANKGLSGFLGEVDRTSQMPALQAIFGAGAPGASPVSAVPGAGTAAQPNSAAVDPQRVANGPVVGAGVTPPTMGGAPEQGLNAGVTAPTFGANAPRAQSPLGDDTTPPQFGMPGLGSMPPPGPPPPEMQQGRMKRLFPTAGEIAAEQQYKQLQGRLQAIFEAMKNAKTPEERDVVFAAAGTPRRQTSYKPQNAQFTGPDGQLMEGMISYNSQTGEAEYDGQPVVVRKLLPTNTPRPVGVDVVGPDGTLDRQYRNPNDIGAAPLATVPTGRPVPPAPSEFSGTTEVDGKVVRLPRGNSAPVVLGDARPAAGVLTIGQQEATAWLENVKKAVLGQLATRNSNPNRNPNLPAMRDLPAAEIDAIVVAETKGRYKNWGDLVAATKRQVGTGTRGADAGGSRQDAGDRVRRRLEQGATASTVQGSGIPQY